MTWKEDKTEWGDYYSDTNYSEKSFEEKKEIISSTIETTNPQIVWDLGANTGIFSRLASNQGINTISFDIDPLAVEKNYLESVNNDERNILPLILDLTNPSSNIGWNNDERHSFLERGPADLVFALALVHHLAISNNVPLSKIAEFFSTISKSLVIEFIPKSDSQVKRLLATREDIFKNYDEENFEKEFLKFFKISSSKKLTDSQRTVYIMEKILTS